VGAGALSTGSDTEDRECRGIMAEGKRIGFINMQLDRIAILFLSLFPISSTGTTSRHGLPSPRAQSEFSMGVGIAVDIDIKIVIFSLK
jgi:hypothetical protein